MPPPVRLALVLAPVPVATLVLALSACGSTGPDQPGTSAPAGVFVNGPLLVRPSPDTESPAMLVTGALEREGPCLRVNGSPALWPLGSTFDASRGVVTTPAGEVALGQVVYSAGAGTAFADLDRSRFTGEALELLESCLGTNQQVLDLYGPSSTPPAA